MKKKLFDGIDREFEIVELDEYDDDIHLKEDFLIDCLHGYFTDYDGFGKFVISIDGKEYKVEDISFSIDDDVVVMEKDNYETTLNLFLRLPEIKKIVWYNR